jgi:hypothetical protein
VNELINFATQANVTVNTGATSTSLDTAETEQDALNVDSEDYALKEDLNQDGLAEIISRKADMVAANKPSLLSIEYVDWSSRTSIHSDRANQNDASANVSPSIDIQAIDRQRDAGRPSGAGGLFD